MEEFESPIVIDNGSITCKAGFAGDDKLRCEVPCLVGQPGHTGVMVGMGHLHAYVGQEAIGKQGTSYHFNCPIQRGIVTNWTEMEKVWHHVFYNELRVEPERHHVLITDAPSNPMVNREKMTEIMFESFNVPGIHITLEAMLSLYAVDITTGIALYSGDGLTYTIPVYEGFVLKKGIQRLEMAGSDITDNLMKSLNQRGYTFLNAAERLTIRNMKESVCYVSQDIEHESATYNDQTKKSYILPDGREIFAQNERYLSPEGLFLPSMFGLDCPGIQKLLHNSILKCPVDTRRDFYSNLVLSGGSTLFPGLPERLEKEMTALAPAGIHVKIVAPPDRKYCVWVGGSIMASLSSFPKTCVQKQEYEETGPSIVHRKFM
nr:actin-3 [Ciona intestinalis]|eukprot:XP_018671023.1 actin-3 [Ciona intestinalis]